MFAHTAAQLNAYSTWNPTISTTVVPTFQTMQIKTLLEANKQTLYLQNFSLNNPVCITAYLCKPRLPITTVEMPNSEVKTSAGAAPLVFPKAADIATDLYSLMQSAYVQNTGTAPVGYNPNTMQVTKGEIISKTDTKYPGQPTSSTAVLGSDGMLIPGESPFNNKWFTQRFKILKTQKSTLQPGKRCRFHITMPPRQLSFAANNWVITPGGNYSSPFALFPHSRFWLIAFHACPAPYVGPGPLSAASGPGGTVALTALDCPPAVLGMYSVEQWCIRQASDPHYPLSQRVSAKQTISTNDTALSFGRVKHVGEQELQGYGGVVAVAPSTAAGSYSSITGLY